VTGCAPTTAHPRTPTPRAPSWEPPHPQFVSLLVNLLLLSRTTFEEKETGICGLLAEHKAPNTAAKTRDGWMEDGRVFTYAVRSGLHADWIG
jgi:hypothetical protein